MNHSADRPAFHLYMTQLALALSCLLALSTNVMGFQADTKDSPETEQSESAQKEDDGDKDEKEEDAPDFLKIGSDAPALDLDYWPTDNNGLLPPVKKFEAGKTYVLNFFQPENAFSVSNLKLMVKLQEKYTDKPVQVVCICSSDRDEADEFLDKKVPGDDENADTYIDFLNSVSTAVDDEQKTTVSYMARSGILTAWTFVVGPTGKVEWLGRPDEVDKPLAKILKSKWDRKAFAEKIEPQQTQLLSRLKMERLFAEWFIKATQGKQTSAPDLLRTLAKGAKDPANKAFRLRIETTQMALMLRALAAESDIDDLEADLPEVMRSVTELSTDDSNSDLNDNAWKVYELYEADLIEKDSELMAPAFEMAEKALTFSPKSGAVNDTVAHFVYLLDGDLDRAIKLQTLAVENSGDTQSDDVKKFLKFLKKEQATGKKKSLQKKNEGKEDGGDSDF